MSERAKAGILASIVAGIGDVLMTGGDAIFALVALLITDSGLLVSFVTYLARAAERVTWLPAAPLDQLVDVVILLVLVGMAYRLLKAWYQKWRKS